MEKREEKDEKDEIPEDTVTPSKVRWPISVHMSEKILNDFKLFMAFR